MNHLPGRLPEVSFFWDPIDKCKEMFQYVVGIFKIVAKRNDTQLVLTILKPIVSIWGQGKEVKKRVENISEMQRYTRR